MRVLPLTPVAKQGGGSVRLIAEFDLELSSVVRLYAFRLMETPDGRRIVYAPNGNGGHRLATFSPELAAEITKAATEKLEGHDIANGSNSED